MSPPNLVSAQETEREMIRLVALLHDTERRLEEMTGGQIDTVVGESGRPFLLRRAQEELRDSEAAKQAAILNALPAHIALLDAQGDIVSVNAAWRQFASENGLIGGTCGLGLNYLEVCDHARGANATEARAAAAGIRSVLAGAPFFSLEYPCHSPTVPRWFLMTVTPLAEARVHGAVVMHLDISERRRIEGELKEARVAAVVREGERRFDFLTDTVPLIIWTARPDGAVDYFNKAWFAYSGLTLAESKDLGWRAVVHPDDLAGCVARWRHACATGEDYEIEYRFRRAADGAYRWFLGRASARCNQQGKILQWLGTGTDIDDRKRAEAELRSAQVELEHRVAARTAELSSANQALQRQQTEMRVLVDLMPAMIAFKDADNVFRRVNQQLAQSLGKSVAEIEGKPSVEVFPIDAARFDADDRKVIESGRAEKGLVKCSHDAEGREVWHQIDKVPVCDPQGRPIGLVIMAQDITARKQLEEQFRQAQKMEAVGTLAGGIAHDFNNILAAISGYTELSILMLKENPEVREHLGAVLQAANRATDLVRQILTFSRQQPISRRPIPLQPIVGECLKLLRATLPTTIAFDTALAADAPVVLADATQVHQVMMNLGTNAWHAMKDASGRLKVTLERCVVDAALAASQPHLRPGVYARVSITDDGCGMDEATQRRIFEPFFTTKMPGAGTGLGLAAVHGIMDSHDGAILVTSQPGEGTAFHLYFPAYTAEVPAIAADAGPTPRGRGERILVIDGEELLSWIMEQALSKLGYAVEVATQPEAALALVRAEPRRFALVITDQTMPGMTGMALASELRRLNPEQLIILTTGYSVSLTPERLQAAGIARLLLKPTTLDALGSAVHAILVPASLS